MTDDNDINDMLFIALMHVWYTYTCQAAHERKIVPPHPLIEVETINKDRSLQEKDRCSKTHS